MNKQDDTPLPVLSSPQTVVALEEVEEVTLDDSLPSETLQIKEKPKEFNWQDAIKDWFKKYWFIVALGFVILLAYGFPQVGSWFYPEITTKV
jgi:hypothetical protein